MRLEHPHTLGQAAAADRIDQFLGRLAQSPPGGVTLKDAVRAWDGNRMTFSFTASRGFFSATIAGVMEVTDDAVVVEAELPSLVRNLVGEDRVRGAIADGLGQVLAP
jgi:hypothetical protein